MSNQSTGTTLGLGIPSGPAQPPVNSSITSQGVTLSTTPRHRVRTSVGPAFSALSHATSDPSYLACILRSRNFFDDAPVGIENSGTDCYRNAVLVLVLRSRRFSNFLDYFFAPLEQQHNPARWQDPSENTVCLLQNIAHRMQGRITALNAGQYHVHLTANPPAIRQQETNYEVRRMWNTICEPIHPTADGKVPYTSTDYWVTPGTSKEQEDAHEWLVWLLSAIDEFLGNPINLHLETKLQQGYRWLQQLSLGSRAACAKCKWEVRNRKAGNEIHSCLKINIPTIPGRHHFDDRKQPIPLADCFRDTMDEHFRDSRRCSRCKQEFYGPNLYTIRRAPQVLMLSLQRLFSPGRDAQNNAIISKSHEAVSIPASFDVSEWLDPHEYGSESKIQYRLSGVVSHSGASFDSGHYVCITRSWSDDTWFVANDEHIYQAPMSRFDDSDCGRYRNERDFNERFTPYIVLYELDYTESKITQGRAAMNVGEGANQDVRPTEWYAPFSSQAPLSAPQTCAPGSQMQRTLAKWLASQLPNPTGTGPVAPVTAPLPTHFSTGLRNMPPSQALNTVSAAPPHMPQVPIPTSAGSAMTSVAQQPGPSVILPSGISATQLNNVLLGFPSDGNCPHAELDVSVHLDDRPFPLPRIFIDHYNKSEEREVKMTAKLRVPMVTQATNPAKTQHSQIDLMGTFLDAEIEHALAAARERLQSLRPSTRKQRQNTCCENSGIVKRLESGARQTWKSRWRNVR